MTTVIPSLSTCVARMTQGERRLAERLEQKLDDDYLVWYDVPVGPMSRRLAASLGLPRPGRSGTHVPNSYSKLDAYGAGLSYVDAQGWGGVAVKRTRSDTPKTYG